ncbi:hypothetical protein D3C72_1693970 [compost metagenome]
MVATADDGDGDGQETDDDGGESDTAEFNGCRYEDIIGDIADHAQPAERKPFPHAKTGGNPPDARSDDDEGNQPVGEVTRRRQL